MYQISTVIEYAKWLNTMNWDLYCTFTTRYSLSLPAARRAMERLYSFIKKNNPRVRLFWVAEPFDTKYGYHTHALISLGEAMNKNVDAIVTMIKKAWQIVSKGKGDKEYNNTVVKPYIKGLGAHYYVAKYMMGKNADYDILC